MGSNNSKNNDVYIKFEENCQINKKESIMLKFLEINKQRKNVITDFGILTFTKKYENDISNIKIDHNCVFIFLMGNYHGAYKNVTEGYKYANDLGYKSSEICIIFLKDIL